MHRAVISRARRALAVALGAALLLGPGAPGEAVSVETFGIPTAASGPQHIARGPDGNLWFTERLGNKIGRITAAGVVTDFPVLTPASWPLGIVAGPDGNLWFTEFTGNRVGRITPAGVVTEFPLPGGGNPTGITAGPDGNLWFTEFTGNRIGRITPAGTITEFTVPTGASQPTDIAAGPDGNLWFTEQAAGKVGRVTPAGGFTEFPAGFPGLNPINIVAGPDGNLWFTKTNPGSYLARMTTAGVATVFAVGSGADQAVDVAVGPDGNLWVTLIAAHKLVVVTTAGQVLVEFRVPSAGGGRPFGVTAGPGGVWFVEESQNVAGRIRVSDPGDFNGDGKADLVTGPGPGGGPHVKVLSGTDGQEILGLFAYVPAFTGGVRVAACDLDGDGVPEIVTAAGFGGGPHVRVFDGRTAQQVPGAVGSFFAYDPGLTNGAFVGCADVNGDGVPDVITGAGPGGGPHVRAFSGVDASEIIGLFAYDAAFTGGVFVAP